MAQAKKENSVVDVVVDVMGESFCYPRIDEMIPVLLKAFTRAGGVNAKLIESFNTMYYAWIYTDSGFKYTAVKIRNNGESHGTGEKFTPMRESFFDILFGNKLKLLWVGDDYQSLRAENLNPNNATMNQLRTTLNKLIAGHAFTRTSNYLLEGYHDFEELANVQNTKLVRLDELKKNQQNAVRWGDLRNGLATLT